MPLKNFNPTSPGQRNLILVDRSSLFKGKPIKKLTEEVEPSKSFIPLNLIEVVILSISDKYASTSVCKAVLSPSVRVEVLP